MNAKRHTQVIELQRRIKTAVAALKALEKCLELEQEGAAMSPDGLADRIRNASKAAVSRDKGY
jgi:hypothetical protein